MTVALMRKVANELARDRGMRLGEWMHCNHDAIFTGFLLSSGESGRLELGGMLLDYNLRHPSGLRGFVDAIAREIDRAIDKATWRGRTRVHVDNDPGDEDRRP